jgi:hypothetical protein
LGSSAYILLDISTFFRYLFIAVEKGAKSDVKFGAPYLQMLVISEKYEIYVMFGFTIYLMHLADYLKRNKSKKKKSENHSKI